MPSTSATTAADGYEGARVAETMTDAFNVRDNRGDMYRKHYPPALRDDMWWLEKISKLGVFHQKLWQHGVETVQEFLRARDFKSVYLKFERVVTF